MPIRIKMKIKRDQLASYMVDKLYDRLKRIIVISYNLDILASNY